MAKNPVHHNRTKHIAIKYHFIRETETTKEIKLDYCKTEDQIANIFTKALPRPRFELMYVKPNFIGLSMFVQVRLNQNLLT